MSGEAHQTRLRWLAAKARSQAAEPYTDDQFTDVELREIAAELESAVPRDPTAELVEALKRCQHRLALHVEQVEMQHMGMPKDAPTRIQFEEDMVALDQSRAALAKWKEQP